MVSQAENKALLDFYKEIAQDLNEISENFKYDKKTAKKEYAFLYWLLLNLYHLDESQIMDCITEGSDNGIDCFVHFKESKELFIIQSKYYDYSNSVSPDAVASFCIRPFVALSEKSFNRSDDLINVFHKAINDSEYKIYFQFYTTSSKQSTAEIKSNIIHANNEHKGLKAFCEYQFLNLNDIYQKYWGESYRQEKTLEYPLKTVNKGTFASLRKDYKIPDLEYDAYYIFAQVASIYDLKKTADDNGYNLFDKNIRDYLGENTINKRIIDTLRDEDERKNFAFYNNGITLICNHAKVNQQTINQDGIQSRTISVYNPQIVNGCQTVNAIYHVLSNDADNLQKYNSAYVLVKVLELDKNKDKVFYQKVVQYTNSQNAIPQKVFDTSQGLGFQRLQEEFEKLGFFLRVKQSDKNTYQKKSPTEKAKLLEKAKSFLSYLGEDFTITKSDISIDLERVLQVAITFMKNGHFAFTQKPMILKAGSEIYKNYSLQIQNYISVENMIKLYFLYWMSNKEKMKTEDKRFPIPHYVIGFLGFHIPQDNREDKETIDRFLAEKVFVNENTYKKVYKYLCYTTKKYSQKCNESGADYNKIIKSPINIDWLNNIIKSQKEYDEEYTGDSIVSWLQEDNKNSTSEN